jgi:hypothetical protein
VPGLSRRQAIPYLIRAGRVGPLDLYESPCIIETPASPSGGPFFSGGDAVFAGIALAYSELPLELIDRHRVHDRGGEPEVRFLFRDRDRVLPVWLDGRLQVVRWGNRRGQSRALPCTAWTWATTLEGGG